MSNKSKYQQFVDDYIQHGKEPAAYRTALIKLLDMVDEETVEELIVELVYDIEQDAARWAVEKVRIEADFKSRRAVREQAA